MRGRHSPIDALTRLASVEDPEQRRASWRQALAALGEFGRVERPPPLDGLPPGSYLIGFQQRIATGIAVGFDRNSNHASEMFYHDGSGWKQSDYYGSIMIRPVFGRNIPSPSSLNEHLVSDVFLQVYPNPASDVLYIRSEGNLQYTLSNISGQVIRKGIVTGNTHEENISDLEPGLYLISIRHRQSGAEKTYHKKIVVAR